MGNPNLSKHTVVFYWVAGNRAVFYGIIADTVVFFGNLYQIIHGFYIITTDIAGVVIQRLESYPRGQGQYSKNC